jgi:hypothetical protein
MNEGLYTQYELPLAQPVGQDWPAEYSRGSEGVTEHLNPVADGYSDAPPDLWVPETEGARPHDDDREREHPRIAVFNFGPRANEIPGPEVLGTFDPHRLLPGTGGTVPLPGHPGYLVRWFPHLPMHNRDEKLVPSDPAAREKQIAETHEHLKAMQRESGYAVIVPSHRSFQHHTPLIRIILRS